MRPLSEIVPPEAAEAESSIAEYNAAMMCTRLAGRAIIKVVERCNNAIENNHLDLSECQLMQIPDAVFHLMRNTELKKADFSSNVISKLPSKLSSKFASLKELNLSMNRLSKLPEEFGDFPQLTFLNLSSNGFVSLPSFIFNLKSLEYLYLEKNLLSDIDIKRLSELRSLKVLNVRENPLNPNCMAALESLGANQKITVLFTPDPFTSWEEEFSNA